MQIGTLTTGAAVDTTINLNYLPGFISYIAATQLSALKVTVEGDGVICDIDDVGLSGLASIRRYGQVTNEYQIPVADGFIPNKVTELVFTNSAAQTPAIYGWSTRNGTSYFVSRRQKVLANSTVNFPNFSYLTIDTPVAADIITVTFRNGLVQKFSYIELKTWIGMYSYITGSYVVDNMNGLIANLQYIPSTDRTITVSRPHTIGNIGV